MPHTILLADDDQSSLLTNLTYLKELGQDNSIVGAPDGKTAYNLVVKKNPDLVIIDWMMPKMTGIETVEKLKQNPDTKDIPVIMVTALASSTDLEKAFSAGVTDYVKKPVDKLELLARARAALQSYEYYKKIKSQKEELKKYNTQLTEAEKKLSELNTIKDIFFSVISSDLNEPLTSLTAFVNLLFKNINNFSKEEMKYVAENIKTSLNSVSSLLHNLIKWSISEINQKQLSPEKIDLKSTLEATFDQSENSLVRKNIGVNFLVTAPIFVLIDKEALNSFLDIFIESSSRFIVKKGEITITADRQDNLVRAVFNMKGFRGTDMHLKDLFNLEYYTNENINPFEKSSGLGYVLCKKLIEKSNGQVNVTSKSTEEVDFQLLLPTP